MNLDQAKEIILRILQTHGRAKNSDMLEAIGGDKALFDLVREDLIFNDLAEDKKGVGLVIAEKAAQGGREERTSSAGGHPARERMLEPSRTRPEEPPLAREREAQREKAAAAENRRREGRPGEKERRPPPLGGEGPGRESKGAHARGAEPGARPSSSKDAPAGKWDSFKGPLDGERPSASTGDRRARNAEKSGHAPEVLAKTVHISFSLTDFAVQSIALRMQKDLIQRGLRVWLAGQAEISSGDALVALLTPDAVKKPDGICLNVINYAQCTGAKLILVMVQQCQLPPNLYRSGWLDFENWRDPSVYTQGLERIVEVIQTETVFTSPLNRIYKRLNPLDFGSQAAYLAEDFIGRAWLLNDFERWLKNSTSRVFYIEGSPGSGKSTILAQLACRYPIPIVYHVCVWNWADTLRPSRFICTLASQLAHQFYGYRAGLDGMNMLNNSTIEDLQIFFAECEPERLLRLLVEEPLRLEKLEKPVLILIDDLDDSSTNEGKNIVRLLSENLKSLPPAVRLVFSAHKGADTVQMFQAYHPIGGDLDRPETITDLHAYLQRNFQDPFFHDILEEAGADDVKLNTLIVKKTGGNFLHAKQVLASILLGQIEPQKPETFPEGFAPLVMYYFNHLFPKAEYEPMRAILEVIFAARQPLTVPQLAYYLDGDRLDIELNLQKSAPFFPNWGGTYRVIHRSIAQWLEGIGTSAHNFRINPLGGHRRIAAKMLAEFRSGKRTRTVMENIFTHLIGSQNSTELQRLSNSYEYIYNMCQAGLLNQYLHDLDDLIQILRRVTDSKSEETIQWYRILQSAIRLSLPIIYRDKSQIASQLIGRLLLFEKTERYGALVGPFLKEIRSKRDSTWVYPITPTLKPPGGALMHTLSGHAGKITAVILTPDGRRIVSAAEDASIRVWDIERGTEVHCFEGHTKKVNAIAVTPDGGRVVSAAQDKTVKIWDMQTGHEVANLQGHTSYVNAVAVTPDGRQAVSAGGDNSLRVWDIATPFTQGGAAESWREMKVLKGHADSVEKVLITPDGRRVISASADKTIRIWDLESGEQLFTLRGHQSIISIFAILPDGRRLVSGSIEDFAVKIWDIESGRQLYILRGHTNSISGFAVTPDGHFAVTASGDKTLKIWMLPPPLLSTQEIAAVEIHTLKEHTSSVRAVVIAGRRKLVISGSADKSIKIWDLESGEEKRNLLGHNEGVNTLLLTPDEQHLVSSSMDNTIKVWDIAQGIDIGLPADLQLSVMPGHTDDVNALVVTADGTRAVSVSSDGAGKVWSCTTSFNAGAVSLPIPGAEMEIGRELTSLKSRAGAIHGLAVSSDGRYAATAGDGIRVWTLESGSECYALEPGEKTYAVAITPNGQWLLGGAGEHTLKVWELASGKFLGAFGTFQDRTTWVRALAVTPGGKRILSAGIDKTIKVWDLRTGKEIGLMRGHTDRVGALIVSSDGRIAVSASDDTSIKFWSLENYRELFTLYGHEAAVRAVALGRDGQTLISAAEDGTLKVWDVTTRKCVVNYVADDRLLACALTPDARTILAGGVSGRVHFLFLQTPDLKHTGQKTAL